MTQEQRDTLVVTLTGLWLGFICAYGIITVGANWIFSVGIVMGSLLFLPGMWEIIFHWTKKED